MVIIARKYVVKNSFKGVPKREDFEVVQTELPDISNGEILVKAEWVSVDPYHRLYNSRLPTPYDQFGFQVGVVEDSKDPKYPVGTRVLSHMGWCDYYIVNAREPKTQLFDFKIQKLPDLKGLSPSMAVGALGMVGATAYFGLLEICQPKEGETVVVTGAAGAVGSIVGQIAKIKGCKVIGFAGTDEKVKYLEKELGFDKAFNHKTVDVSKALKEAAPGGVDCYFDNVGGEISSIIINNMNLFGRISVCGSISAYNEISIDSPKATILQPAFLVNQLKMEGFIVLKWLSRWQDAIYELSKWISSGQIKIKEHVTEGFDKIYDAFIGMLDGENTGKAIVKL